MRSGEWDGGQVGTTPTHTVLHSARECKKYFICAIYCTENIVHMHTLTFSERLQRYCTGGCMDASQISQCNANIQVTDDDKKRCTTFQSAIVSLLIHIQIIYHDQVSLCVQRYLAQKTLCGSAPFL